MSPDNNTDIVEVSEAEDSEESDDDVGVGDNAGSYQMVFAVLMGMTVIWMR